MIKLKTTGFENFDQAFKRLSVDHQKIFNNTIDNYEKGVLEEKFFKLNIQDLEYENEFITLDKEEIMQHYKNKSLD